MAGKAARSARAFRSSLRGGLAEGQVRPTYLEENVVAVGGQREHAQDAQALSGAARRQPAAARGQRRQAEPHRGRRRPGGPKSGGAPRDDIDSITARHCHRLRVPRRRR